MFEDEFIVSAKLSDWGHTAAIVYILRLRYCRGACVHIELKNWGLCSQCILVLLHLHGLPIRPRTETLDDHSPLPIYSNNFISQNTGCKKGCVSVLEGGEWLISYLKLSADCSYNWPTELRFIGSPGTSN